MGAIRKALGLETLTAEAPEAPVGDYSADVQPPSRSSSPTVTVDRALSLPSAFRCVQLISTLGAMLGLNSWRGDARVDPAPALLTKPDPWRTRGQFIRRYLTNAATDGNNFLFLHGGRDGIRAGSGAVELLNPFTTFVRWETRGGRWTKLYDVVDPRTRKSRTLTDADVLHVWGGIEVPGYDRALGPVAACRYALSGIIDTRDYASGWFSTRDDDVPSGILTTDQRLDPPAFAEHRKVWNNPQGFDADGKPLPRLGGPSVRILGQGLHYEPVLLKPSDAQWLEAQGFGVLELARLWGMPAEYLEAAVDGSSLVYSSLPMLATRFLSTTMFPVYLRPLEEALSELLPRGQEARFEADELLRPDAKTRAEIDVQLIAAEVYDGAYVRKRDHIDAPAPKPRPAQPAPAPAPQEVPA